MKNMSHFAVSVLHYQLPIIVRKIVQTLILHYLIFTLARINFSFLAKILTHHLTIFEFYHLNMFVFLSQKRFLSIILKSSPHHLNFDFYYYCWPQLTRHSNHVTPIMFTLMGKIMFAQLNQSLKRYHLFRLKQHKFILCLIDLSFA